MIIPDANVLIYAHDQTAVAHRSARRRWEATLSGSEPVGIPWVVALAFVRLMTHPTLSENPMTIEQARGCVEGWLSGSALEESASRVVETFARIWVATRELAWRLPLIIKDRYRKQLQKVHATTSQELGAKQ